MSLVFPEQNAPSTPTSQNVELYCDQADEKIKVIDDQGFTTILSPDGFRDQNRLMNGDFSFALRQVPTTLTSSSALAGGRQYAFDRWFQSNGGGSTLVQTQQVSNLSGAEVGLAEAQYGKFKVITTTSKLVVGQIIENANCAHLLGTKVIFQFKAKYSVAASMAIRFGLVQLTSAGTVDTVSASASGFISAFGGTGVDPTLTAAANLAYITPLVAENGAINGSGVDVNLTTGWVRYSATFLVPATSKNLIPMIWTNASVTANDELNLSEIGLYAGEERRDWHPNDVGDELVKLLRYYEKSFPLLIAPAASTTIANAGFGSVGIGGKATTGAEGAVIPVSYKVLKRISVTPTLLTPVAAGAQAYRHNGTTPAIDTGTVIKTSSATAVGFIVTAVGDANAAIGDIHSVHWTADAEI